MEKFTNLPDKKITPPGIVAETFLALGIGSFQEACRFVHALPYGYNSDRDEPMILFKEKMGTCTTKHAVIATLAAELNLPIIKSIGIYPMTDEIVTGTGRILATYNLPYVPMLHCFLVSGDNRIDLTEGNRNGKKHPLNHFLFTQPVDPNISAKSEYRLYRRAVADLLTSREELGGKTMKSVLQARQEGLALLRSKLETV